MRPVPMIAIVLPVISSLFSLAMMFALMKLGILRVSKEGELEGLDVHEHGVPAYPEYVLTPSATPHGAIPHATAAVETVAVHRESPSSA